MGKIKDISGKRFGRLLAIEVVGKDKHRNSVWRCMCDCGNETFVACGSLTAGNIRSCGCLKIEMTKKANTRHGAKTGGAEMPEYRSYRAAKERCRSKNNHAYQNYGGRGIEFRFGSFDEFLAEIGPKPSPKHTLDRIDNDGHYEPGNVRWATRVEQNNNKCNNKLIEFQGKTKTLAQWCRKLNLDYNKVKRRLYRGWPVDRALLTL